MDRHTDVLVVGQGLAGSLLGWQLMQHGLNVIIIDNNQENASQIAAGIINPVTGKRLLTTENCVVLLSTAKQLYQEITESFKQPFYFEKTMIRVLRDQQQLHYAKSRLQDPNYLPYLECLDENNDEALDIISNYGLLKQKQTAYLDTELLLKTLKEFFLETHRYLESNLAYSDIKFDTRTIRWNNITAKLLIFCEGYYATKNPWFKYLPFQLAKGEILTLLSQQQPPHYLINYGNWMLPLNDQVLRTGATFENSYLDCLPQHKNKQKLINAMLTVLPSLKNSKLLSHQAGIRPCTLDKQPFIGFHPLYRNLGIFNGFGTKGCLQIPWYSKHFCKQILNQSQLPSDCDIARYVK